ncbi:peptidoglycan editing factor PgeF [Thalassotalea sp. LPB0316]|uniref:peptidoglycan editing factor PgeF n=1 Tax=Thalassotalea sp. LPB0316 TaxID=2769490 RepID=UPI0018669B7E|nr:peptidoglycan editing factor PgeF [Thalassotalea sp. LPB0316]QOL25764.1 peptidoglycan editing factor PgeF [Thalassotalea sp. LPB0316]
MQKTNTNSALISIDWPIPQVLAFSTTRQTPDNIHSSTPPFNDFNIALHVDDDPEQVADNRKVVAQFLPAHCAIQWLDQVHGGRVEVIKTVSPIPPHADAAITREKGVALAIMTADCLPILIADKQGKEVAAIHAGWRPLSQYIITNTLAQMKASPDSLSVWLGPCISKASFEVGKDVKDIFVNQNKALEQAFSDKASGKYLADLQAIAKHQLIEAGVNDIKCDTSCTLLEPQRFFSYRRDRQTGRMVSIICIR